MRWDDKDQFEINCSLEFNGSKRGISPMLLTEFLWWGAWSEACFTCPTCYPRFALQLGVAQPLCQGTKVTIQRWFVQVQCCSYFLKPCCLLNISTWSEHVLISELRLIMRWDDKDQFEINRSLEFNSSKRGISPMLLTEFLWRGAWSEACFTCPTGYPSFALQLGVAQPLYQGTKAHTLSNLFINVVAYLADVLIHVYLHRKWTSAFKWAVLYNEVQLCLSTVRTWPRVAKHAQWNFNVASHAPKFIMCLTVSVYGSNTICAYKRYVLNNTQVQ